LPKLNNLRQPAWRRLNRLQPSESVILGVSSLVVGLLSGAGVWLFKQLINLFRLVAFNGIGGGLAGLGGWTIALGGLAVGLSRHVLSSPISRRGASLSGLRKFQPMSAQTASCPTSGYADTHASADSG
jgi:hypothetical protein